MVLTLATSRVSVQQPDGRAETVSFCQLLPHRSSDNFAQFIMTEESLEPAVNGSNGNHASTSTATKPRARLGPMEVVQLPSSDSEDDEEDEAPSTGEEASADFLKDYPEDTEVIFLAFLLDA